MPGLPHEELSDWLGPVGGREAGLPDPGAFRGFIANRVTFLGKTDRHRMRLKLASAAKPVNCGDEYNLMEGGQRREECNSYIACKTIIYICFSPIGIQIHAKG